MGLFGRIIGLKPRPPGGPAEGEALTVGIAGIRDSADKPIRAATLVFCPALRDDPVFLSRVQWRLQGLLYDGEEPVVPADAAARDRVRDMGIAAERPRTYLLSNDFAPGESLYATDVSIPSRLYPDGFEWGGHDHLLSVRYDVSGAEPTAELIPQAPDPTAIARARLDGLLRRGAKFVWAELVQANYTLYQPGQHSAACMVMFSFDYTVQPDEMRKWAEQLHPLKHTNPGDPVLPDAVFPLECSDRGWYYHRRFPLPLAYTGGRVVYLADVWAHRPFIDGRFRSRSELPAGQPRRVPILAEKKETGWAGVELIPFNEAKEYQRRAVAARNGD